MDFSICYLSFFVIQSDGVEQDAPKTYRHYQTLSRLDYENSAIKAFLDGEFTRIVKRKAEVNPATENPPTKIGRFMLEGYELTGNPNYNLFGRLRSAADKDGFKAASDDLIRAYMDTSAVRGGAFIVASAKLSRYFDEPFIFVLKCDFESNIARISDEKSLISQVEMAISARNMKSIQYPHMPEEGMLEEGELKIHQASHARYFEDFLKYVSYEKSRPELVEEQLLGMVQQYMETKWQDQSDGEQEEDHTAWNNGTAGISEGNYGQNGAVATGVGGYADHVANGGAGGYAENGAVGRADGYAERSANGRPDGYVGNNGVPGQGGVPGAFGREGEADNDGADGEYGGSSGYGSGDATDQGRSYGVKEGHGIGEFYNTNEQPASKPRKISDARRQEEARLEIWAAGEKRELQERWNHEQVIDAAAQIVELQPDWEMKFKLDGVSVRAKMEEYGKSVHLAKLNGRYVVLIEGDSFQFEKARSPIELLHPEDLDDVIARLKDEHTKGKHESGKEK